jgi:hypothetical protein
MNTLSNQDILTEVWEAKDRLSSAFGHDLKATCGALYAEQQRHPGDFVNLGSAPRQNQLRQATGEGPTISPPRHVSRPAAE